MAESNELEPEVQAELDAMLAEGNFDALMEGISARPAATEGSTVSQDYKKGQKVSGLITQVGTDDVLVELDPRTQGVCPRIQFTEEDPPVAGTRSAFMLHRYDRTDGLYILGRVGKVQKASWEYLEEGQIVEAQCMKVNKGGLEMEVAGHRAFMPAGQASVWRVENLEDLIGQTMACEVTEFNRKAKNIVLSRRAVMERERQEQRDTLLASLEVGNTLEGTVRKVMPFGAFVDLGGVDGLVHVSDLSYERVKNPEDVVKPGQVVMVQILSMDPENDRIGLGMKQCTADPFASAANAIEPGANVTGRITRITAFGAFVELSPGVEGLIHISELSHERVNRVSQVVKEDEIVTVSVLDVDADSRRISLSLKALQSQEAEEEGRPEDKAMAKLRAKFGSDQNLKGGIG